MLGRSQSLRDERRRPAGLSTYQRLSMVGPRSKETVPPMTGQAAASARAATGDPEAPPVRPLQSKDPNRMGHGAHPSAKPAIYPSLAAQTLWPPPPKPAALQRAATAVPRAHTWRPVSSKHESNASHPLQQPVYQAPGDRTRPAPRISATAGGPSVFRSTSLRSYFQPPKRLAPQPSLAQEHTPATSRTPMSYTLAGDDLEAVLRKGLEAVRRRQGQAGSEWRATPAHEASHRGQHARLGDQSLQQLASSSYAHVVPACKSINAERRPEIRHARHHYAPHIFESHSAEIYVMR